MLGVPSRGNGNAEPRSSRVQRGRGIVDVVGLNVGLCGNLLEDPILPRCRVLRGTACFTTCAHSDRTLQPWSWISSTSEPHSHSDSVWYCA